MTPTNAPDTPSAPTKKVSMTVFDLQAFDDVKLVKNVTLPAKPATLEDALAAVGNDKRALLDVIYDGLCEREIEQSKSDLATFQTIGEDGEPGELYTGTPISEEKGKAINASILGLAKALGYDKSLPKEKKREIKEQASKSFGDFVRANPAMLATMQG